MKITKFENTKIKNYDMPTLKKQMGFNWGDRACPSYTGIAGSVHQRNLGAFALGESCTGGGIVVAPTDYHFQFKSNSSYICNLNFLGATLK